MSGRKTVQKAQPGRAGKAAAGKKETPMKTQTFGIAFRGLLEKFSQNEDLKKQLPATGDAYLVECAYKDTKSFFSVL